MTESDFNRLINEDLDGELDSEGRKSLETFLQDSSDGRTEQTRLRKLQDILDNLPEQSMPENLHSQILQQMSIPHRFTFGFFRLRSLTAVTRIGYAIAASFVLGIGILVMNPDLPGIHDSESMVGTLIPQANNNTTTVTLDEYQFKLISLSSSGKLHRKKDSLAVELKINSEGVVRIVLDIVSKETTFSEFKATGEWQQNVSSSEKNVTINSQGQQSISLPLSNAGTISNHNGDTRIKISYFVNGESVQEHQLVQPD